MTTSAKESLWLEGPPPSGFAGLSGEGGHYDAIVVGGGIAGLTTAALLKEAGATVAVLEAERVGRGVTGTTTAKVTALQGNTIAKVRRAQGEERAAVYAQASAAAVGEVSRLAERHAIECDLERRPAETFAMSPSEVGDVEAELDAARDAGLPVEAVRRADLPFDVARGGPARRADPVPARPLRRGAGPRGPRRRIRCLRALAGRSRSTAAPPASPASWAGRSAATGSSSPLTSRSSTGGSTSPPCSSAAPTAWRCRSRGQSPGRCRSTPARRSARSGRRGDLLIVGGEGHEPGSSEAQPERFERLEEFARERWEVEQVTHRWSAQDPTPYDELPSSAPTCPAPPASSSPPGS